MDLSIRMKLALVGGPTAGIGDAIACEVDSTQDAVVASGGGA